MTAFFQNIINLVAAIFIAIYDVLTDISVAIIDQIWQLTSYIISLIPFPAALSGGLQSFLNGIGGDILFFLGACGLASALALIGGGYVFRVSRKFLTLFQW
ncbi:hypothetical protein HZU77_016605 [Neisseriaceae bacterium TC5R-5]|nr:hypothetical protein [Neisseriaceae bacterium TC5R-5]MDF0607233.1 hypothetical protein [Neisseriaceae bacterium TC5R-5]